MDNKVKKLINKIIDKEYDNASDRFVITLKNNGEFINFYKEQSDKREVAISRLKEGLTDEQKILLDEIEDESGALTAVEARLMFKEGVKIGATDLSYLSEFGLEIKVI